MAKSIGMILDGFYPADIRVKKEADALISAGFSVALLCKRRKDEEYFEVYEGIQLMRINAGTSHFDKGILDILSAVNFIHPVFNKKINLFIDQYSVDALHVHDLPLVKTAVLAAQKHGIKTIADFHENYPAALSVWFQWKKNPLIRLKNSIFFGFKRWKKYETWAVQHVDYVIAVVDEMKQRLIIDHAIEAEKIIVITNSESKSFVENNLDENIYKDAKDKFILAYTGGVGPHRGVDTVIDALGQIENREDIVLYITGTASADVVKMLQEKIEKYKLASNVHLLGYRPFDQFYSYMKMASVNIIPHHSNDHTDNTIPHKLFQCMMVGKPLLVSSSAPLKRVVSETKSGLVFKAGDSKDAAEKILELKNDRNKCQALAENGQKHTLNGNYNWDSTSQILVEFYNAI